MDVLGTENEGANRGAGKLTSLSLLEVEGIYDDRDSNAEEMPSKDCRLGFVGSLLLASLTNFPNSALYFEEVLGSSEEKSNLVFEACTLLSVQRNEGLGFSDTMEDFSSESSQTFTCM